MLSCGLLATGARADQVLPFAVVAPDRITLAESARLTLALEGPVPLRVELPDRVEQLLAPESAIVWRLRPTGPAVTTPLPGGRERWERGFRLDPFASGKEIPLALNPVRVRAGTALDAVDINWPSPTLRVDVTINEARPDGARPVTGFEEIATPPVVTPTVTGWSMLGVLASVFATVLAFVIFRKARAPSPILTPEERACRELDRIARDVTARQVSTVKVVERLVRVVRGYIERRHALPASTLTTPELVAACEREGGAQSAAALRDWLGRCDRVRFAGDDPAAVAVGDLITAARHWLQLPPPSAAGGR